ncbi:MAG: D-2-hydroxyacid dehydrogenase [Ruminococcaceae bacterium]|nr:D-2-hydroxyacid dehydrogenase [Oscillospiraceae bacterium]
MKILITDSATVKSNNDLSLDVLEKFGDVFEFQTITNDELLKQIADTDILLCNKTLITKDIMDKSPTLKYIGLFATGYNNIDIDYAKEKGIVVCNAGSYSTNAVAQQVIGYILNHYCRLAEYDRFVKDGEWKCSPVFSPLVFSTDEVYGKTLGIIGYGNIAKAVEKTALALGMNVLVHTRTVRENNPKFVSFDTLLEKSDIVSVHCPLNEQSREMFNKDTFKKFKDGAYFINTARGGVVNEQALFDALECGKLSGAAVDVLTAEPMEENCVLFSAKNITITPHTAWAPLTTRKRLLNIVCDNINAFLDGKPQNNVAK